MITWLLTAVACLALLPGCAGMMETLPPAGVDHRASVMESDELITPELSAKRLQELYARSGIPGWDPSLEKELRQWDHQVTFDVPIQVNKQVRAYLIYFCTERKGVIGRALARSTRYLPMIKEIFQEYGLPEDLAYLAMIESGFNPEAYSPAGACGMWQFIKGTARRYGLVVDGYVDERRDPQKSTRAAARYLLDLYKQFGSWYLALASYNCGEKRVEKELSKSSHKNFWELSSNRCLPGETKNYVPQMIAATIIAKNPEKFGFKNGQFPETMMADYRGGAGLARDLAPAGPGDPEMASRPVDTPRSAALFYFQPGGKPTSRTSSAGSPNAKSKTPRTRAAAGNGGKPKAASGRNSHTGPYVASLWGAPRTASAKGRENQSPRQTASSLKKKKPASRATSRNKKQNAPVLATKRTPNPKAQHASKKRGSKSTGNYGKLPKKKSSALIISKAQ
jgi:hypothetical protein